MQKTNTKGIYVLAQMSRKGDHLRILQDIKVLTYYVMYAHKLESVRKNETYKIFWDFERQKDPIIPA